MRAPLSRTFFVNGSSIQDPVAIDANQRAPQISFEIKCHKLPRIQSANRKSGRISQIVFISFISIQRRHHRNQPRRDARHVKKTKQKERKDIPSYITYSEKFCTPHQICKDQSGSEDSRMLWLNRYRRNLHPEFYDCFRLSDQTAKSKKIKKNMRDRVSSRYREMR